MTIVKTTLDGGISADPVIDDIELFGINHFGNEYDLTKSGLKRKK